MIVREAPPEHYAWIAVRAGLSIGSQFKAIEALDALGNIAGMVGYDGWTPNAVSMHVAIDNPMAVKYLRGPAFRIPFLEHGKGLVNGAVLSTNQKAIKFDLNMGFRETHRIRDGWAKGVDIVMFEMRKDECRWLVNQRLRRAA